jgi:peptide/nickel transport system ATP-binding protein
VPQNAGAALNPSIKIGRQVTEVLKAADGIEGKAAYDAMIDMFHHVNLVDPERVAERYPHELSGGMQQRVTIAMALISNPDLLIMDEPTTGLDVTTEAVILDLVRDLIADRHTGVIYITHNLGVVARSCERVAVMYAGRVVEESPVRELFRNPKHPYTRGLIAAVPKKDVHRGGLEGIPGIIPNLINPPAGCRFNPRCEHVMDICRESVPPAIDVGAGHRASCFLYAEDA